MVVNTQLLQVSETTHIKDLYETLVAHIANYLAIGNIFNIY